MLVQITITTRGTRHGSFPWEGSNGAVYTNRGTYWESDRSDANDIVEEVVVSSSPFNFDAFHEVLQKSTAICAKGKADIAAAVAAGKGEKPKLTPALGHVYLCGGVPRILGCDHEGRPIVVDTKGKVQAWTGSWEYQIKRLGYTFAATSLASYVAGGGLL